jgi:ribose 1,5-bisphosphate isomerase
LEHKDVITAFLRSEEFILLLRRSSEVGTYKGKWAAVSGFLEGTEDPLERAEAEINEEVALTPPDIKLVRSGEPLRVYDEHEDIVWIVHPFLFDVTRPSVRLDWEHSEYKWVRQSELVAYETVPKLKQTFDRVRWDLNASSPNLTRAIQVVEEIAHDSINGAGYLGRKAIAALQAAAKFSGAQSSDGLFRDILHIGLKLRAAQPSMATVWNLTGKLLNEIDYEWQSKSVAEFRESVEDLSAKAVLKSEIAEERVSRNLSNILLKKRRILTHSYSNTVKRALQLCKDGAPHIYVTESAPAFEGRVLARDLKDLEVSTHVLPDAATRSFPVDLDAIVVGADSILADGSVVNKSGTKDIGQTACQLGIPVYVGAEMAKLNAMQFLGQPMQLAAIFDQTPSDYITSIVTEHGEMKPAQVILEIKRLVRELYT